MEIHEIPALDTGSNIEGKNEATNVDAAAGFSDLSSFVLRAKVCWPLWTMQCKYRLL